jgi:hypothetical protein
LDEPAIRFYKGLGAVRMDDWTIYRVAGKDLEALAAGGQPPGVPHPRQGVALYS